MTDTFEPEAEDGIDVRLPSGATFQVMTELEEGYLLDKITRYMADNHFLNVSDHLDIDKLVTFELMIHRWTSWVSMGRDYWDNEIPTKQYADLANQFSTEVRQLKKALGVDKVARDRSHGDDSVPAFWDSLLNRAQEFGYMRNEQFTQSIESMQRIKAIITYFDNCTDDERLEFHVTMADVMEIIKEEVVKFDRIDENFRNQKQRLWIKRQ